MFKARTMRILKAAVEALNEEGENFHPNAKVKESSKNDDNISDFPHENPPGVQTVAAAIQNEETGIPALNTAIFKPPNNVISYEPASVINNCQIDDGIVNNEEDSLWVLPLENDVQQPLLEDSYDPSIIHNNMDNLVGSFVIFPPENIQQQILVVEKVVQNSIIDQYEPMNHPDNFDSGINYTITDISSSNISTTPIDPIISEDGIPTLNNNQLPNTHDIVQSESIDLPQSLNERMSVCDSVDSRQEVDPAINSTIREHGSIASKDESKHNFVQNQSIELPQSPETEEDDPNFEPTNGYDSDDSGQDVDLPLTAGEIDHTNDEAVLDTIDHGDMMHKRKRRLTADPDEWKKNKTKKLRMFGKSYTGYSRTKDGVVKHDQPRKERTLLPPCQSKECSRSKFRNCSDISEEDRKQIFDKFWTNMNWDQRKVFVTNHVPKSDPKRIYTKNTGSRRNLTLQYNLTVNNKKLQVCKKMFLATISLGEYSVLSWVKKSEYGMNDSKETSTNRERQNNDHEERKKYLKYFFDSLPKLPSHYGRRDSSKLYLENTVQSLAQLFRLYNDKCTADGTLPMSRPIFCRIFNEMNLSIHQLKKDKCDICTQHEVGNISDEIWNAHILKKNRARQEKFTDKEAAKEGKIKLLTMDLQAVKVSPSLQASAVFFKTKLSCHNFTIYDLVSHHVKCFWFTECEADLTASTFTSCIIEYLTKYCATKNDKTPITIFSDGCTYQNRNTILSNALLHYAIGNQIVITQKFLEPGQTQMECDSVHSCIERKLKGREIHLPSDYLSVTKEARLKPFPYDAMMMEYHQFNDYSIKKIQIYSSIRPGKIAHDPVVTDIKALQYSPEGRIHYKLDFDDEWRELPQRPKIFSGEAVWPQLFKERRKITFQKWKHLQELKKVIPRDCHHFYDTLPHDIK